MGFIDGEIDDGAECENHFFLFTPEMLIRLFTPISIRSGCGAGCRLTAARKRSSRTSVCGQIANGRVVDIILIS